MEVQDARQVCRAGLDSPYFGHVICMELRAWRRGVVRRGAGKGKRAYGELRRVLGLSRGAEELSLGLRSGWSTVM